MGKNTIFGMLPALTDAVSKPTFCIAWSDHIIMFMYVPFLVYLNKFRQIKIMFDINVFQGTAIMYMRRAGLPWETIVKITGHASTVNLVKFYDLKLEAQGRD